MLLTLSGHNFRYECENLCRVFFPYSPVRVDGEEAAPGEPWARAEVRSQGEAYLYTAIVCDGKSTVEEGCSAGELAEYPMTRLLFSVLSRLTGLQPAWGMLTGVHPVKLLRMHCQAKGFEEGTTEFQEKWLVSPRRTSLARRVLEAQREATEALRPEDFSLYISIPFCPTRCAYCSFISQDLANAGKLMEPYFQLLLAELERVSQVVKGLGLTMVSAYVGGGTPTTLSAKQLAQLCQAVHRLFPMERCLEFTVEAGRPDTITQEKLEALKSGGVTRISINPQSLSDQVLHNIGRKHSAVDVEEAFALAHQVGFSHINADLIVGLPGDDVAGFCRSLEGVMGFGADNITVHSLALKRSARLVTEGEDLSSHKSAAQASEMADYAINRLTEAGFVPYYLYRQTRMAGNLENVGWAKPGAVCRYNIYTMDESGTVIACGAGGVSKLKDPWSQDLKRIFNFKYPFEYISRHQEILERKDGAAEIYEQFRQRLH